MPSDLLLPGEMTSHSAGQKEGTEMGMLDDQSCIPSQGHPSIGTGGTGSPYTRAFEAWDTEAAMVGARDAVHAPDEG